MEGANPADNKPMALGQLTFPPLHNDGEAEFETYKRSPELLKSANVMPLPARAFFEAPSNSSGRPHTALQAEARALALRGRLGMLFGGTAAAMALGRNGVAIISTMGDDGLESLLVPTEAPVVSVAVCTAASQGASSTTAVAASEILVLGLLDSRVACVNVSIDDGAFKAKSMPAFTLPWTSSEGEGSEAWILTACHDDDGAVGSQQDEGDVGESTSQPKDAEQLAPGGKALKILLYRVARREVEVLAIRVALQPNASPEASECVLLAALHGERIPWAACWLSSGCAAIVALAGLHLRSGGAASSSKEDVTAVDNHAAPPPQQVTEAADVAVLTTLHTASSEVHWSYLPRGQLHGAWAMATKEDSPAFERLLVALGQEGHKMAVACIGPGPMIEKCWTMPAVASLALARPDLRLVLATAEPGLLAMVEAGQNNAVTLFRHPSGACKAPFIGPDLAEWAVVPTQPGRSEEGSAAARVYEPSEVLGLKLFPDACLIALHTCLVHVRLDMSIQIQDGRKVAAKKETSEEQIPLGIDKAALLKMLDAQGED